MDVASEESVITRRRMGKICLVSWVNMEEKIPEALKRVMQSVHEEVAKIVQKGVYIVQVLKELERLHNSTSDYRLN